MTDPAARFSPREIEEIVDTRWSPDTNGRALPRIRPAPVTLRELVSRPELMQPPPSVLPHGLAMRRCVTLLSAREKVGKSTALSQGAAARSSGGEFLGERLVAGPVLWYALDEPLGDLVRRLEAYGADLENFSIQTEIPTPDDLYREITSTGAELVVGDTLSRMWRGKVRSANDGEEIAAFIWPYIEAIRATDAGACFTYHTSRGGREYRGSVEIGATVDVPLTLRKRGHDATAGETFDADYQAEAATDDGRRLLAGVGRGVHVSVRLTFANGRYVLGDSPMPLQERLRTELAAAPASANSLVEMLKVRKQDALTALHDLRTAGQVEVRGAGARQLWQLTQRGVAAIGSQP